MTSVLRSLAFSFAIIAVVAVGSTFADASSAPTADDHFAQGQRLLAQGDLDSAAESLAAAAEAAPENQQYRTEHALIRRVMLMRPMLAREADPAKWERLARALRSYYYDHRAYSEALALDHQRFERTPTPDAAALLAESQLETDHDVEAIRTVSEIEDAVKHPRLQRLKAIALVRTGKADEARSLLPLCTKVDEKDAAGHVELARLYALLGAENAASSEIGLALQWTPPSRVEIARKTIRSHPDFTGVIASEAFTVAMATESKVKESSCSGGTSCGSCPSRSTCSGDEK